MAIRDKYKIPDNWIFTIFKNVKKYGWFRQGKQFWQKTRYDSARMITGNEEYSSNFFFHESVKIMTHTNQVED